MGSAVSTGVNNDDLVNNLVKDNYILTHAVEQVFRAVDRGHFVDGKHDNEDHDPNEMENGGEGDTRRARMPRRRRSTSAYEDLAWREGNLHLSAPCIYTHVMEELDLRPGLSFLNIGSGTGYLNLMVGHIIGPAGCNHGVEIHQECIDYANERIVAYVRSGPHFDKYNIGLPEFFRGNGMCLSSECFFRYDRVYCGAAVPSEHIQFMKQLVKPGGVLVLPCGDQLVKITVKDDYTADLRDLLPVSFASLIVPSQTELKTDTVTLPLKPVPSLKQLCRTAIRDQIRSSLFPPDTTKVPAMPLTKAEKAQKRRMTRGTRARRRRARPLLIPAVPDTQNANDTRHVSSNQNEGTDINVSISAEQTVGAIENDEYAVPRILPEDVASGIAENIANDILNEVETNSDEGTIDVADGQRAQAIRHNPPFDLCEPLRSENEQSSSSNVIEANDELDSSNDSLRKGFNGIAVKNEASSSETKGSLNPQTKIPEFLFNCIGTNAIPSQSDYSNEQPSGSAKKAVPEDTSNSSEASPSSSLPKQPKRMRITNIKDKPQSDHEKSAEPTSSKDSTVFDKVCVSEPQTDSEKDCLKAASDSSVGRVTTSEESNDGPNSTTEDSQGSLVDIAENAGAENRRTATRDLLFPQSTATETTESLDERVNQIQNEEEEDEADEPEITPVSLPFPIRFFLEMQNHVRTLDIDDIMSNPRRSLDVLEGGGGGRSSGESRGGGVTSPGTSRDPGDETYLEADSENEDDEDDDSGLSGDNAEGGASIYTLASSKIAWPKTASEKTESSMSTEKDKTEGKPHPSVFWMRDSINKLDLPQFLIEYLLYNRKYVFD